MDGVTSALDAVASVTYSHHTQRVKNYNGRLLADWSDVHNMDKLVVVLFLYACMRMHHQENDLPVSRTFSDHIFAVCNLLVA
jgi:hypothetical protein